MANKPKAKDFVTLEGYVTAISAPDKAPGGPTGPTYICFSISGTYEGRVYNGVFYIEIGDGKAASNASAMARGFAIRKPILVTFDASRWIDRVKTDPGGFPGNVRHAAVVR